ncbi:MULTISPECIES: DUF4952 domain-containing protein [Pseudomonas]|uniref:DUF4952 domain-containing protein n=1 Tax=Pseudomonas donghuensis TaxID=1163398 RepID=A0AAP0SAD4_9PSED|nr:MULTISPECIES: DUF4952 domain-containing protein [Pseudomonas]MDF9895455.1 hypothetical protein [Pseudomonas vranovensis]KDN97329.1 DUF4952 domain-containing protein [Pseudomonas donghuensis]MBS7597907.1 DUF4952 domain-containing protein [Pseudomonas sp. RC2C2]MCP6692713.1 DUF4952 domain-containing protein [Pseudomonas donghuensis]MCP6699842.1 DUF4952 domain-containing protein [Pseudomonas donghuensis]
MRPLITLALLLLCSALQAAPLCENFLSASGAYPKGIEYLGCHQEVEAQTAPLIATYKVKGSEAAVAEAYLQRTYGMGRLQFFCCMWDSLRHFHRDPHSGIKYQVLMASEETLANQRSQWAQIEFFYITVSVDTLEP